MLVRSISILGAATLFAAAQAPDASARGCRGGSCYKTCYKRVVTPPVYKTVTRQVMVSPATCSQYRTPPQYGTVAQEVVVQPAHQVVHHKPAVYGKVAVQKMVRPARTRWVRKRGGCHGADYKCAVTTPAKYRTRHKRVVVEPASSWVETRPAVKGVVHKQVVIDPGQVRQVCQPAQYQTVTEQVMVSPGTEHWVPVAHTGHAYTYHQPVTPVRHHRPHYTPRYAPMK